MLIPSIRSQIFDEPAIHKADKFAKFALNDTKVAEFHPKLGAIGAFIVLKGADLGSPYGPLPAHLFWIRQVDLDGMIECANENEKLFRQSAIGEALLNLK